MSASPFSISASPFLPCKQVQSEITHRLPIQVWLPSCKHRNQLWLIWVKWRCIKGCWEICRIWARAPDLEAPTPSQEQHPDSFSELTGLGKTHGRHCRVLPLPPALCHGQRLVLNVPESQPSSPRSWVRCSRTLTGTGSRHHLLCCIIFFQFKGSKFAVDESGQQSEVTGLNSGCREDGKVEVGWGGSDFHMKVVSDLDSEWEIPPTHRCVQRWQMTTAEMCGAQLKRAAVFSFLSLSFFLSQEREQ